jgi:hypothetical protein
MNAEHTWNDSQFDEMSWHDNHVHGLRIREGEFGSGELELDIDYIVEWICPTGTTCSFRVAPATLTFLEVSDLRIDIDYAKASAATTPFCISGIARENASVPSLTKWTIELNWPAGSISFCASGYSQVLRGEAIVSETQGLKPAER